MSAGAGQRQATPGQATLDQAAAVVVHGAVMAAAALAAVPAGRGVRLLSAAGAAGSLGAAWFLGIVSLAAATHPGVPHWAALDCGAAPGQALAALRAGARRLILDPDCPAFAAVAAAAATVGAELWMARPPALDLGGLDLRHAGGRRLAEWLTAAPETAGDSRVTLG